MTRALTESCVTARIPAGSGDGLEPLRHVLGGFVLAIGELRQSLLYRVREACLSRVRKNVGLRNGVVEGLQELPGAGVGLHLLHGLSQCERHATGRAALSSAPMRTTDRLSEMRAKAAQGGGD